MPPLVPPLAPPLSGGRVSRDSAMASARRCALTVDSMSSSRPSLSELTAARATCPLGHRSYWSSPGEAGRRQLMQALYRPPYSQKKQVLVEVGEAIEPKPLR